MIRDAAGADERDDAGSVLLLTLGYAVLALALILVCANATSLYLAQKRVDSVADAAALAAADGFVLRWKGDAPIAELTPACVHTQALAVVDIAGGATRLVRAETPDGVSARVTVAGVWHPVVFSLFVPDGFPLEATATSRNAVG